MLNKSYIRALIALFLPIVGIVAFGCSNANNSSSMLQHGVKEIVLTDVEERDLLFPNNLPDSCHFIALETNEKCLIEYIRKIEIVDSLIFIQDANSRVLVFDFNGRFRNQIGTEGRGRGEYFSISTFYVDSDNDRVVTADSPGNSLLFYDYGGHFIDEINFDDVAHKEWGSSVKIFRFIEGFTSLGALNDSLLLLTHYAYKDFEYYFSILNLNNKTVIGRVPQPFDFPATAHPGDYSFMSDEKYLYTKFFDTIYHYLPPYGVVPAYLITSSLKRVDSTALDSWRGFSNYDFYTSVSRGGYSRGVMMMHTSNSHLLLHCMDGEYQYRVVVDLKDSSVTKTNLSFFAETDRAYLPFSFQSTYGDGFVAVIKPTDMVKCVDDEFVRGHTELSIICKSINEDDNPIIGIYYIKKRG